MRDRAEAAAGGSLQRPHDALAEALDVLAAAEAAGDDEVAAMAARAAGMAARELDDLPGAEELLRRSVRRARRSGLRVREGEGRLTLAHVLALAGDTRGGRCEAAHAASLLEGPAAARALAQQAVIAQRTGHYAEALDGFRRALAVFRRHGLDADVALLRQNRGIVHAYRGELAAARADLDAARGHYERNAQELAAAEVVHNLGFVAALAGDIPAALRCYDEAAEAFRALRVRRPLGLLDRGEALLAGGLAADAHAVAAQAVAMVPGGSEGADHAEALLACARAALAAGRAAEAGETARRAERRFRDQHRPPWAAVAAHVALQAEAGAGAVLRPARAAALAAELEAQGWGSAALDAHLLAGEAALRAGSRDQALRHLVAASAARRSPLAERRVRAWHAEAMLREATGRRAACLRAVDAGLDVLAANRATLGATELRAGVARHGEALARLGVDLAVASGRAPAVLRRAEGARAATDRHGAPTGDPGAEEALAELRATTWALEEATLAADGEAAVLRRRRARLEAAVRQAALRSAPGVGGGGTRPPVITDLRAELDGRALVELVTSDGAVHAVVVTRRRATLRRLCANAELDHEVAHLRFALVRAADAGALPSDRARSAAALGAAARRVSDLVVAPLAADLGDAPIVLVPAGALHGLPWGVLPGLRGRPVAVAPSAAAWLRAARRTRSAPAGRVALVAGPGLAGAAREVGRLAALHRGSCTLRGPAATVAATATALDGASLAHVAAHGTFRGDNPRFSSVRLADGPLLVHDLERLPAAPTTVVLSACHAAEAVVTSGEEVLGLAGALLAMGSGNVVASVAPVPDQQSVDWMVRLHEAVAAGRQPSEALAAATERLDADAAPGPAAALAGFVCYGAG